MAATKEQMEARQKWLIALRSGKYKQTQKVLVNREGYCCLGVACVVAGLKARRTRKFGLVFDGEATVLPSKAMNILGLKHDDPFITPQQTCAGLNDELKLSFKEIADVLEPLLNNPEWTGA